MNRLLPLACLAFALMVLSGCLTISGERAVMKVYAPKVELATQTGWPVIQQTLAIAEPNASAALDSTRIAVRPTAAQLQVYAGAIWSDPAPILLQSTLIDALGGSGHFRAVVRPTDPLAADLLLRLDLRHFEAMYAPDADAPTIVIELQATLIEQRTRRVLDSRRFRVEEPSASPPLPFVVAAFESALGKTAAAITPWVLENAPRD